MNTSNDYQIQSQLELSGGKAVHPSWGPFFNNCSPCSSRGMAATLYTQYQGQPITKTEIKLLWKSFNFSWTTWLLFTPDTLAIYCHYQDITTGHPVDNWVRPT